MVPLFLPVYGILFLYLILLSTLLPQETFFSGSPFSFSLWDTFSLFNSTLYLTSPRDIFQWFPFFFQSMGSPFSFSLWAPLFLSVYGIHFLYLILLSTLLPQETFFSCSPFSFSLWDRFSLFNSTLYLTSPRDIFQWFPFFFQSMGSPFSFSLWAPLFLSVYGIDFLYLFLLSTLLPQETFFSGSPFSFSLWAPLFLSVYGLLFFFQSMGSPFSSLPLLFNEIFYSHFHWSCFSRTMLIPLLSASCFLFLLNLLFILILCFLLWKSSIKTFKRIKFHRFDRFLIIVTIIIHVS